MDLKQPRAQNWSFEVGHFFLWRRGSSREAFSSFSGPKFMHLCQELQEKPGKPSGNAGDAQVKQSYQSLLWTFFYREEHFLLQKKVKSKMSIAVHENHITVKSPDEDIVIELDDKRADAKGIDVIPLNVPTSNQNEHN